MVFCTLHVFFRAIRLMCNILLYSVQIGLLCHAIKLPDIHCIGHIKFGSLKVFFWFRSVCCSGPM